MKANAPAIAAASFNWATPVKAWRCGANLNGANLAGALQLGHAGEGVEIPDPLAIDPESTTASIGPRR